MRGLNNSGSDGAAPHFYRKETSRLDLKINHLSSESLAPPLTLDQTMKMKWYRSASNLASAGKGEAFSVLKWCYSNALNWVTKKCFFPIFPEEEHDKAAQSPDLSPIKHPQNELMN